MANVIIYKEQLSMIVTELKTDKDVVLKAVGQNGVSLLFGSVELK